MVDEHIDADAGRNHNCPLRAVHENLKTCDGIQAADFATGSDHEVPDAIERDD